MKKTNGNGIIEVLPIDVRSIPQTVKESETILAKARAIKITTQPTYLESDVILKRVKTKISELDTQRKTITGPLDLAKTLIMNLFRKPVDCLKEAEEIIKNAQLKYIDEQERLRREQEEKLRHQAERERRVVEMKAEVLRKQAEEEAAKGNAEKAAQLEAKAEAKEQQAETIVAPTIAPVELAKGSAIVIRWFAEIIDINLVPREYMIPDMALLNKLAIAGKDTIKPPAGIVFRSNKLISCGRLLLPLSGDIGF